MAQRRSSRWPNCGAQHGAVLVKSASSACRPVRLTRSALTGQSRAAWSRRRCCQRLGTSLVWCWWENVWSPARDQYGKSRRLMSRRLGLGMHEAAISGRTVAELGWVVAGQPEAGVARESLTPHDGISESSRFGTTRGCQRSSKTRPVVLFEKWATQPPWMGDHSGGLGRDPASACESVRGHENVPAGGQWKVPAGGQGRGRTADLPIFSRTLVPTELPGPGARSARPTAWRPRPDLNWRPPP